MGLRDDGEFGLLRTCRSDEKDREVGDDLLLDPDAAFAGAQRLARDQGGALTVTAQTLWKRMVEQNLIVSRDDQRGRNIIRRTVGGPFSARPSPLGRPTLLTRN